MKAERAPRAAATLSSARSSTAQNVFQRAYNQRTNKIGTSYQQGFLPVPFYRLTF